ncbi:type II toxin-antitoxin system RelE/ParE family toxin [Agathobacter sp.]|uniref:type II toxin-antitoxin system RelE/ParE family toxin n=1 Tax=Agathobacter sp. TaxID=2021311 RepID=UPI003AB63434
MNEYEVRVTRQALEQMKEIVHYISNDLIAPDAAGNLLDKMKAEITKLSSFPKKQA